MTKRKLWTLILIDVTMIVLLAFINFLNIDSVNFNASGLKTILISIIVMISFIILIYEVQIKSEDYLEDFSESDLTFYENLKAKIETTLFSKDTKSLILRDLRAYMEKTSEKWALKSEHIENESELAEQLISTYECNDFKLYILRIISILIVSLISSNIALSIFLYNWDLYRTPMPLYLFIYAGVIAFLYAPIKQTRWIKIKDRIAIGFIILYFIALSRKDVVSPDNSILFFISAKEVILTPNIFVLLGYVILGIVTYSVQRIIRKRILEQSGL